MKTLLKGIKRRGIDILSLDRMSAEFCTLAANYVFLMACYTLESIFVNTLLLRISGQMYTVFIYRGFFFAFIAIAMVTSSLISRWVDPVKVIRISGVAYALMFLIMFIWMERLAGIMYFLGALGGMASGFYFSSHHVLLSHYTTQENRSVAIGIGGIIEGCMTLLVPLVSGFVIQLAPGMAGYRVIFGLALVGILAQSRIVSRMVPVERIHKPKEFRFAFKLLARKVTLRMMLAIEFFRGFRGGAFVFFLNSVLFQMVDNESLVGFNSFLTGALTIIANWTYGRIAKPSRRVALSTLAVTILMGFGSMLIIFLNAGTIILFNVINSFFIVFLINALVNNALDLFGENAAARGVMSELISFREIAHSLGRITGLIVLALFPQNLSGNIAAMLVLTASQYMAVLLLVATRRVQNRKKHRPASEGEPA